MMVIQASERMSNVDRSNSNSWKIIYTMYIVTSNIDSLRITSDSN